MDEPLEDEFGPVNLNRLEPDPIPRNHPMILNAALEERVLTLEAVLGRVLKLSERERLTTISELVREVL